jgi:hypothetical protein
MLQSIFGIQVNGMIRLRNCLVNTGITPEEAKSWSDRDLLSIPRFGQGCLAEMYALGLRSTGAPAPEQRNKTRKSLRTGYGRAAPRTGIDRDVEGKLDRNS